MGTCRLKNNNGFTLIEVLLTGAILAFGIVSIYESLLVSMDTHGYYTHYLSIHEWINEKIWSVQSDLIDQGYVDEKTTTGTFVRDHKTYEWTMNIVAVDAEQSLYQVSVDLSWKEGGARRNTSRTTYIMPTQLKRYGEETYA